MDWTQIIEVIGGTAVVVAAIAWVAQSTISHFFSRELEEFKIRTKATHDQLLETLKHQQGTELEALRARQQEALAAMRAQAEERLTYLKAALSRVERLESDLIESRGKGYGEIWKLTGSLNLFGPMTPIESENLAERLKNWYFEHGWVLTQESKRRYFLVQEVLGFGMLQSLSFRRPADEMLFSSPARPLAVLRQLRSEWLGIEVRGDESAYGVDELEAGIIAWKSQVITQARRDNLAEQSWVLLQFVLSAFRTGIVEELGSRKAVQ